MRRLDKPAIKALGLDPDDIARWDAAADGGDSGGGSFLSTAVARVDPLGSDATGTVGDLTKPFLTVQAAITAIESGSYTFPVIDIGNNRFQGTVTTSLPKIRFQGYADEARSGGDYFSKVCVTLACTASSPIVELYHCEVDIITSSQSGLLTVTLEHGGIAGDDGTSISAHGAVNLNGDGITNSAALGDVTTTGGDYNFSNVYVWRALSDGVTNLVATDFSFIHIIHGSINNCTLSDSRTDANLAGGTKIQADSMLTNIVFPDADPHVAGAGYWVAGVLTKSAG